MTNEQIKEYNNKQNTDAQMDNLKTIAYTAKTMGSVMLFFMGMYSLIGAVFLMNVSIVGSLLTFIQGVAFLIVAVRMGRLPISSPKILPTDNTFL